MKEWLVEGKKISINAQRGYKVSKEDWVVHRLCKRFAVLDNGLFKTCAFYDDLKKGQPILLYPQNLSVHAGG